MVASQTNTDFTNFTKITAGGYADVAVTDKQFSTATGVLSGDSTQFSATATWDQFRYYMLYNDSATAKNAICFWDRTTNSLVTLSAGETFTISFNSDATDGTIFTISSATA